MFFVVKKRPLWTCPECGAQLVTKNMWHSCGSWSLEHHFVDSPPVIRAIFDRFQELVEACGPVTMIPQGTRIAFMVRVRFGGCVVRKKWVNISLWMMQRLEDDPRLAEVADFNRGTFGHRFRISDPEQLDDEFAGWVREAYRVGCQEHLDRPL